MSLQLIIAQSLVSLIVYVPVAIAIAWAYRRRSPDVPRPTPTQDRVDLDELPYRAKRRPKRGRRR